MWPKEGEKDAIVRLKQVGGLWPFSLVVPWSLRKLTSPLANPGNNALNLKWTLNCSTGSRPEGRWFSGMLWWFCNEWIRDECWMAREDFQSFTVWPTYLCTHRFILCVLPYSGIFRRKATFQILTRKKLTNTRQYLYWKDSIGKFGQIKFLSNSSIFSLVKNFCYTVCIFCNKMMPYTKY